MSIRLKDTITDSIDKLDGQHSSYFAHTIKIGTSTTEYNSNNSIITLPAYPTIPTIPTTLPNPKSLSWSGYNTGSYSGSTAASFVIPNNTNQLINGAEFITASSIPTTLPNPKSLSWSGYSSGSYDGSTAKSITIPNNTNQLTNGAGFITASSIPTTLPNPQKLTITVNGTKTEYDGNGAKLLTLTIPSSITNYVTTDTNQSISGTKTFSKTILIKNTVGVWVQKSEADNSNTNSIPYIRFGKYTSDNTASNDTINGELGVNDSKELVFYKGTSGGEWLKVYHAGNFNPGNYLPLSGGTLTNSGDSLLTLVSNTLSYVNIRYSPKGASYYWKVGANSENIFYFNNSYLNKDVIKIDQKGEMKFIGESDDSRYTISYYSGIKHYGSTGGWAMGGSFYKNNGTYMGESYGGYGSNGGFDYFYYGGSYSSAAMYIKDGKVGIGTNSPETKFHIKGGNMFLYSSSTPYIAFKNDDGSSYYCDVGAYKGVASVWHEGRGWETILTSGNWSSYISTGGSSGSASGTLTSASENDCVPSEYSKVQHFIASSTSNSGADGFIQSYRWSAAGYVTQIYYDVDPNYYVAVRHRDYSSNWTSWRYLAYTDSVLSLSGGTMTANARIEHTSGYPLYLGNSDNSSWVYLQDCASQDGHGKWCIYTNGNAHFSNLYLGGEQITFTT